MSESAAKADDVATRSAESDKTLSPASTRVLTTIRRLWNRMYPSFDANPDWPSRSHYTRRVRSRHPSRVAPIETGAAQDWQLRVSREARINRGALAEVEHRAPSGRDD